MGVDTVMCSFLGTSLNSTKLLFGVISLNFSFFPSVIGTGGVFFFAHRLPITNGR